MFQGVWSKSGASKCNHSNNTLYGHDLISPPYNAGPVKGKARGYGLFRPASLNSYIYRAKQLDPLLTELELTQLASGSEQALKQLYKAHYSYVTGWLVYREKCPPDRVGEFYSDAVLRVRDKAMQGELEAGNLRAYLLRTAINGWKMELRRQSSLLKRHERYLEQLPQDADPSEFDQLIRTEEETGLEKQQQRHTLAVLHALELLSEACRQLLTDTIVNGLKVGGLVEKYALKDARGVTAKKQDCKGQLRRLTLQVMEQNGWMPLTS